MSVRDVPPDEVPAGDGARTAAEGTPVAVDVSRDRRARFALAMFVSGPVIWSVHFMVVYLVVEAGCSEGPGLALFDPPVPKVVTLAATVVAVVAALACAGWSWRRWQADQHQPAGAADEAGDLAGGLTDRDRGGTLAFAGFLLSLLSAVTILFVGLPALILPSC